jgi:hypothetical protein
MIGIRLPDHLHSRSKKEKWETRKILHLLILGACGEWIYARARLARHDDGMIGPSGPSLFQRMRRPVFFRVFLSSFSGHILQYLILFFVVFILKLSRIIIPTTTPSK